MTRRLELTAAEWAVVPTRGWLVRPADICTDRRHYIVGDMRRHNAHDDARCPQRCHNAEDGTRRLWTPPAELVAAAAYCEDCGLSGWAEDESHDVPYRCPECLIELVGECPTCEGTGALRARCPWCKAGTVALGYAYAASDVLPIYAIAALGDQWPALYVAGRDVVYARHGGDTDSFIVAVGDDPATLVGQYALQLEVVR